MADILRITLIISIFASAFRMATIILLAALGELVVERSGVLNLSVEGMMLSGALAGFLGAYFSGSLWIGVLSAMVVGVLTSMIYGVIAVLFQVDQTVTGLAVNFFLSGMTFYLYRTIFPDVGTAGIPSISRFPVVNIPLLSEIPYIGRLFFSQQLLTYIAVVMVVVIWVYFYRTKSGLILRTMGENPRAVDMKGVNVTRYRFFAVMFGGLMAGLAGSFITLASAGIFAIDMTAGRGWLAIAIIIFGDWKPGKILLAAIFFGFIDALQMQLQTMGFQLPFQLFLALPYLLTVVAVFIGRKKKGQPLSLGVAYLRE